MKKSMCIRKADGSKLRYEVENEGTYFVCAPHKKRWGWRMEPDEFFASYTPVIPQKSEFEQWHSRMRKAVAKMEKTGLWADVLIMYKNLLTIPENEYNDILKRYGHVHRYIQNDGTYRNTNHTEELMSMYVEKYPFLFRRMDNGTMDVDDKYFYPLSECILKSMYFGRYNKEYKREIAEALSAKRPHNIYRARASYDASYEYHPDEGTAFYSEEYKNCGNGHYYLALDGNTAVFCEDD
jgi:hypothetical protein